jgi:hypothetical protein
MVEVALAIRPGNDVREDPRVVPPARTPMPTQPTFTCATCDHQIGHDPVFHLGLAFCCAGCAADGPCMCSYDAGAELVTETRAVALAVASTATDDRVPGAFPADVPAEVGAVSAPLLRDARRRGDGRRGSEEPMLVDVGG